MYWVFGVKTVDPGDSYTVGGDPGMNIIIARVPVLNVPETTVRGTGEKERDSRGEREKRLKRGERGGEKGKEEREKVRLSSSGCDMNIINFIETCMWGM